MELMETWVMSFLVPRRMLLRSVFTVLCGRRTGGGQRLKQGRCRSHIENLYCHMEAQAGKRLLSEMLWFLSLRFSRHET